MTNESAGTFWQQRDQHRPSELRALAARLTEPILRRFPEADLRSPATSDWVSVWVNGNVVASLEVLATQVNFGLRLPLGRARELAAASSISIQDEDRRGRAWIQSGVPSRQSEQAAIALIDEAMRLEQEAMPGSADGVAPTSNSSATTAATAADVRWTAQELEAAANAYMDMLGQQRAGEHVVKAGVVALLREGPLSSRSLGSVSQRFSNITEVLRQHGLPVLDGYPARQNVGRHVADQLWGWLQVHPVTRSMLAEPTFDDVDLRGRTEALLVIGAVPEPDGQQSPPAAPATGRRFQRDPKVQAWVRQQASGVCELCEQPAPFQDSAGRPFLEVHHVLPLGLGGSDRVSNAAALCPNCHRRCHLSGDAEASIERLYEQVSRLAREEPSEGADPIPHALPD